MTSSLRMGLFLGMRREVRNNKKCPAGRKYHKALAKLYGCTVDELLAGDESEK